MPQSIDPADLESRLMSPRTSLLHRCCIAVGAAAQVRAEAEEPWLDAACAALCSLWPSRVIAHALVARRAPLASEWSVDHAGVAGAPSHSISLSIRRDALSGWGRDTALSISTWPLAIEAPVCSARADLIPDDQWNNSRLRLSRDRLGIHEFIRVVIPYNTPKHQGALALQIDAIDRAWRPDDIVAEAVRGVAPAVFRAYYGAFVARDLLRERLLSLLPAERRAIAPLLAQGLSERDVARRLGRSHHTVHDWIRCAYRSWGVNTRFELREIWAGLRPAPEVPEPAPRGRGAKRARNTEVKPMASPSRLTLIPAPTDAPPPPSTLHVPAATIDRAALEQAMR